MYRHNQDMSNNQALRPSYLSDFATVGKEERKEDVDVLDEEQKALAYLANLKGWTILKEYIERISDELDQMVRQSMEAGASYEEIGKKTLVKEITKDVIRRIIERVEENRKE